MLLKLIMKLSEYLDDSRYNDKDRGKLMLMSSVPALAIVVSMYLFSCLSCGGAYLAFNIFVAVFGVLLVGCIIYSIYLLRKNPKGAKKIKWKK